MLHAAMNTFPIYHFENLYIPSCRGLLPEILYNPEEIGLVQLHTEMKDKNLVGS
jgi:hypothetical protein